MFGYVEPKTIHVTWYKQLYTPWDLNRVFITWHKQYLVTWYQQFLSRDLCTIDVLRIITCFECSENQKQHNVLSCLWFDFVLIFVLFFLVILFSWRAIRYIINLLFLDAILIHIDIGTTWKILQYSDTQIPYMYIVVKYLFAQKSKGGKFLYYFIHLLFH